MVRKWIKRILFRLLAVLIGVSPLVVAEGVCRIFDWGRPELTDDPFVGFGSIHPLFVFNDETGRYEIPPPRWKFFCPDSFPKDKSAKQRRVFVLGGSTVQGRPYQKETSFTTWLELSLNAADRNCIWDVVNCGGISYASYRLVPILQEVLDYQPDLIIVCTGHNEFLEDRTYRHWKDSSAAVRWFEATVGQLRTYQVLRSWIVPAPNVEREMLGPDVWTKLDPPVLEWSKHQVAAITATSDGFALLTLPVVWDVAAHAGGFDTGDNAARMTNALAKYQRDDVWRERVIAHFKISLERMAALARKQDVPIVFVAPVANWAWPPFKSQHRDDLTAAQRLQFARLFAAAENQPDLVEQIRLWRQAETIDDRFALLHFRIGQAARSQPGGSREAKQALGRALMEDVCPLRMLPEMHSIMQDVCRREQVPFLDFEETIALRSPDGIPDSRWLVDHVHPTIEGHQLLANEIVALMAARGWVTPRDGWESDRDRRYERHIMSLPATYFVRGRERLRGLLRWANGNARYASR